MLSLTHTYNEITLKTYDNIYRTRNTSFHTDTYDNICRTRDTHIQTFTRMLSLTHTYNEIT